MSLFVASAFIVLLLATAAVVFPLLRKSPAGETVGGGEANLDILRDQLAELDADLRNGVISPDQHEVARMEIERRVLDESQGSGSGTQHAQTARRWLAPALTIAALPAAAIALYLQIGSTEGLDVDAYIEQQASEITPEKVEQMTRQLAQHLEQNPDDAEGWAMLGRAYRALHEFEQSARAWARAAQLQPKDADVLTDFAEALGLAAQGDLSGEPTRLLERALQLDPAQSKALALGGSAAFGREDYAAAIDYWQKLLALSAGDEQLSDALRTGIAEAQARMDQAGTRVAPAADTAVSGAISGTVSLSAELVQSVAAGDTVFVFARAAEGPGMPLAAARVQAGELPYRFRLDDSMAIMPGRKMSDAQELVIGARISKSGVAARSSGDLEGFSAPVKPGANDVRVVIDQRVP